MWAPSRLTPRMQAYCVRALSISVMICLGTWILKRDWERTPRKLNGDWPSVAVEPTFGNNKVGSLKTLKTSRGSEESNFLN